MVGEVVAGLAGLWVAAERSPSHPLVVVEAVGVGAGAEGAAGADEVGAVAVAGEVVVEAVEGAGGSRFLAMSICPCPICCLLCLLYCAATCRLTNLKCQGICVRCLHLVPWLAFVAVASLRALVAGCHTTPSVDLCCMWSSATHAFLRCLLTIDVMLAPHLRSFAALSVTPLLPFVSARQQSATTNTNHAMEFKLLFTAHPQSGGLFSGEGRS